MKTFTIPTDGSTITEEKSVYTGKILPYINKGTRIPISLYIVTMVQTYKSTWDISADGKTITNVKVKAVVNLDNTSIVKLDSDSYGGKLWSSHDYSGYNRQGGIITTLDIPVDG